MVKIWACEICDQEGELIVSGSSWRADCNAREAEQPNDILTFNMGRMYSLRVCRSCREKHSDEDLRNKIRERLRKSRTST